VPKNYMQDYEENYSGHESDFIVAARDHGLDAPLVRELRDRGIRMAIEAAGKPVSEQQWKEFEKSYAGKLKPAQITALKAWWRSSVERS